MKLCKCGCGLEITDNKTSKVYYNEEHRFKHKLKHPEKRIGNYINGRDSGAMMGPIQELLMEQGYPRYISRTNFSLDLQEKGVVSYGIKDIRYHVAIILPKLGYIRRNKHSYQRKENA